LRDYEHDLDDAESIDSMKNYFLVRWKKRWPVIPAAGIWVFVCHLRFEPFDHERARGCIVMCVIFIMIAIFFPFRWGGEDLER